jgi:nitric oxide reductase NorD protein
MFEKPMNADELEESLEEILWAEASSKRSAAESLAGLERAQQELVLAWVETLEKDNLACAYQFLTHAHRALAELETPEVEAWIIHGLDVYDRSGLYAAVDVFRNVDRFLERARVAQVGATLEEHAGVLERIVLGLSGRRLKLEAGEAIYTDTEILFLPETAARFDSREDNFRFLKAAATHLWAQTRFGTWRQGVIEGLVRYEHSQRALRLFHVLEMLRLDAVIARELPGIHREMQHLNRIAGQTVCPPGWESYRDRLRAPGSSAGLPGVPAAADGGIHSGPRSPLLSGAAVSPAGGRGAAGAACRREGRTAQPVGPVPPGAGGRESGQLRGK